MFTLICPDKDSRFNPFAEFGYDVLVATSSKGEFQEFHDQTDIVEIGSVLFNRRTKEIVKILDKDETTIDISSATAAMSIDPHCERYYWISPYAYVMNNPLKFIDPDGRDVVITGVLSNDALKQLQDKAGKQITLSMNESGKVSYTMNEGVKKLKGDAKSLAGMINDGSITVNLITTDKNETSTGNLMIGGAFMGNTVTTDANGNVTVSAQQEVNPNVLGSADEHTKTPGSMMMHETSEAYKGAKMSQKSGISSPRAGIAGSIYNEAHNAATPQSPVYEIMYDKNGNETKNVQQAVKIEWSVSRNGKSKVIQTLK